MRRSASLSAPRAFGSTARGTRAEASYGPRRGAWVGEGGGDALSASFEAGDRLGRYELTRVLGDGGFATVWRARSVGPGGFERAVAIKVMPPARAKQKRFQNMLFDEARLAARIEHPSVAQIWEVGEDPRSIYIVMELVDGAPLDVLRDRAEGAGTTLPIGAVFRALADVCAGLHAAHELRSESGEPLGLVHRDVSPQNILVSRHGNAKIIDFGIAKAKERLGGDTKSGFIKGKVSFMAPEQARAEDVDRRADVWAVGAVAYDIFAGHPPVDAASDLERLAHLAGPAPIPPLDDTVPEPLRAVVARALEKDPDARFATALELKLAIEEALIESEHETGSDDVARLFAPYFPSRAPSESTVDGPPVTPSSASPPEAEPPRDAAHGASSTLDARSVEGSIEIPVNGPRLWPIAIGAALAGGIAWLAFFSPSASSDSQPTRAIPSVASSAAPASTSPASTSPASTGAEPTVSPSGRPSVAPSSPASAEPHALPAPRPAPAPPAPARPARTSTSVAKPAAPPAPPPAAPTPAAPTSPPARNDEDAIE